MSEKQKLSEQIWEKSSGWIDQIGVVVGEMAKQLGVASEHVYTIYTKQVFYEGLMYATFTGALILALFLANVYAWFATRKLGNKGSEMEIKWTVRVVAGIVLLVIGGLVGAEGFIPNMLKLLNPEYYTIKEIIDQVGKVVK